MNHEHIEGVMYERAVAAVRAAGAGSVALLQGTDKLHASYGGAIEFLERMRAAGIVQAPDAAGVWELVK